APSLPLHAIASRAATAIEPKAKRFLSMNRSVSESRRSPSFTAMLQAPRGPRRLSWRRMANSFGTIFRVTTWGESHGGAMGAVVDGCPAKLALSEADLQPDLD